MCFHASTHVSLLQVPAQSLTGEELIKGQYKLIHQVSSRLTEDKSTAVVANALSKVDVGLNGVTLIGVQVGTENRDTVVALELEGDVGSRAGEV